MYKIKSFTIIKSCVNIIVTNGKSYDLPIKNDKCQVKGYKWYLAYKARKTKRGSEYEIRNT